MGSKLSEKNPNITDLSDSNRPTKISEKYSELYDNEWTDALETLTGDTSIYTEESAIQVLLACLQVNIVAYMQALLVCKYSAGITDLYNRPVNVVPYSYYWNTYG